MGSKVLLLAICWLSLNEVSAIEKTVNSSVTKDNVSAESAPRLYKNLPVGIYAGAAPPYGSFSYISPATVTSPVAASSHQSPVTRVVNNANGYLESLKDSYGKFLAPQAAAYKTAFPQQFVSIQALPAHLSQPLVAAATPSYQYRPSAANYFFGSQYKIPSLHSSSATPTPITRFGSLSQPLVYAENIRSFAPSSSFFSHNNGYTGSATQQHSPGKVLYGNAPNFQKIKETEQQQAASPVNRDTKQSDGQKEGQIQAAPAQTSVTAIVNGKKTVVTLETQPPIPLLDLSLLEPLTFDNPVVPQVQHFLPKISSVTYAKLPQFNVQDAKKNHKEIIGHKTKSHTGSAVKNRPKNEQKGINKKPHSIPAKTHVVVKGNPEGDEFSYEINTPNHKETYNEQVVSYNKKTNMKPVTYTYNKKTQNEPEHYTYSHSSKEPLKITHVEYGGNESPKHLVYTSSPEEEEKEQNKDINQSSSAESEDSSESSKESDADDYAPQTHSDRTQAHYHEEPPKHSNQEHTEDNSKYADRHNEYKDHQQHDSPRHTLQYSHHQEESPQHNQYANHHSGSTHSSSPKHHNNYQEHHTISPEHTHHNGQHDAPLNQYHYRNSQHYSETPRSSQYHDNHHGNKLSHNLKPEHRAQEFKKESKPQGHYEVANENPTPTQYYSQPLTVTVQNAFQAITPEYEEDIVILPTHKPNAPIKVDPNQHVPLGPSTQYYDSPPSPAPQVLAPQQKLKGHSPSPAPHSAPYSPVVPHIHEKSKRIIIKDKEESPDEMHTHMEQVMAEMIDREENDEEDFEKAYKASAVGFPAYEESGEEDEDKHENVFDPESYGVPKYHRVYNIEHSPFQQYQEEGDQFPKSARLSYKDTRDNNKEDYYLDFSVNKPDVYTDYHKKKVDYYKTYKKNRPEKTFYEHKEQDTRKDRKEKKNEKFLAAPSFVYPASIQTSKPLQYFAHYKAVPKFELDYSKGKQRDSDAYASGPYHKYRTHFAEPQFQYGFEPIAAPLVLDRELAAMASNDSPESEKPGTRKKIYKENWYIKKTSTTAAKPS